MGMTRSGGGRGRRQTPGRPLQWGTTDSFLDHFGLETLRDLPGTEELKAAGLLDASPAINAYRSTAGEGPSNEDENTGIAIVRRALEEPLRQIIANAGGEGSIVVQKVAEGSGDFGYNARTEEYQNLISAGVIDPKKVSRVALENAASIGGMILTTECVLSEIKEEAPAHSHGPDMGGMGGMM